MDNLNLQTGYVFLLSDTLTGYLQIFIFTLIQSKQATSINTNFIKLDLVVKEGMGREG